MASETTRVLVVEDDPQSVAMVKAALMAAGNGFRVAAVDRLGTAVERLRVGGFDVVLLDLGLPDSSGLGTFATLYAEAPDTPIVVLTGKADETTALKAVKSGAQDYLIKGQLHGTLLARALRYAIERRRAEEQIALQARLLEAVGEAVIATDRDGVIRYWNRFAERLYGWSAREVLGRNILDVIPLDRARPQAERVLRLVASGETWTGEMELLRRDGTSFPAHVVDSPIHDAGGDLIGIVGTSSDITDRKRAEQALQASEQRLRIFVEQVPAILWSTDRELRFTSCLGAGLAAAQLRAGDLYGQPVETFVQLTGVEVDLVEAHRRAAAGEPVSARLRFRSRVYEAHVEPLRGGYGEVVGTIGIALDVTDAERMSEELRLSERALRESNDALTALITASPVAILALDTAGRLTMWNPTAERMFGWREDEVLGGVLPIVTEEDREALRARLADTLAGSSSTGAELVFRRRDGTDVDVSLSAAPLRDASGQVKGVVAVLEDLSPRKQLEERLLHSQKMEAIGRLAGGVAHDFNNLLTAITGHAQILLEAIPERDPARADLLEIDRAAARAASLTKQLLAFSRKQVLQPAVLDVNALVSGVERMLRRVIGDHIQLTTLLDPATGRIKADPGQIEQVIMNLVVNARDAMPGGGTIVIETSNRRVSADDPTAQAGAPPGDYVLLTVTDNGVGMDRDTLARIFEPFFTTKEPGRGTGLGLSTVYGIVNQSGGEIWAYSEPGQGTVFKVFLPRVRTSAVASPAKVEPAASAGSETILLVEDEPAVRALSQRVLQRYGYRVIAAASGDEAIALAEGYAGAIHLMLTDMMMPGMSGREVAARIQASRPDVPVLYTSGYTPDEMMQHHVIAAGAPFLQKPFTPAALAAKVREVLDVSLGVGGRTAR